MASDTAIVTKTSRNISRTELVSDTTLSTKTSRNNSRTGMASDTAIVSKTSRNNSRTDMASDTAIVTKTSRNNSRTELVSDTTLSAKTSRNNSDTDVASGTTLNTKTSQSSSCTDVVLDMPLITNEFVNNTEKPKCYSDTNVIANKPRYNSNPGVTTNRFACNSYTNCVTNPATAANIEMARLIPDDVSVFENMAQSQTTDIWNNGNQSEASSQIKDPCSSPAKSPSVDPNIIMSPVLQEAIIQRKSPEMLEKNLTPMLDILIKDNSNFLFDDDNTIDVEGDGHHHHQSDDPVVLLSSVMSADSSSDSGKDDSDGDCNTDSLECLPVPVGVKPSSCGQLPVVGGSSHHLIGGETTDETGPLSTNIVTVSVAMPDGDQGLESNGTRDNITTTTTADDTDNTLRVSSNTDVNSSTFSSVTSMSTDSLEDLLEA
ncbi:uncharacterized protein LOC128250999 [Octopus bimaculoides]|uniref:uncharacterized protein LOC128250999 n=1 Tax=Octopus bimaculoides TaxID=37653 RepID=UPI0022E684F6|nr:uncharacterized protein LOC128250999 [Octopus bimaculoides]